MKRICEFPRIIAKSDNNFSLGSDYSRGGGWDYAIKI